MGGSHSWAVVNRNLAQQAIFSKNVVSISSFNGYNCYTYTPHIYIDKYIGNIDYTISYTNPHNYGPVFNERSKFKIGVSNYESSILPPSWSSYQHLVDRIVVSSEYSRLNFIRSGFDSDNVRVVALGTNVLKSSPLFSNGRYNFLNISAPHRRKNISQVVRCYYKAFSHSDNVCLTIKTSLPREISHFSVNVHEIIKKEQEMIGRKPPMIQIITDDVDDMSSIYSSCDCLVSCSASEGFGLPMLEARGIGLEVICPKYSGQMDFLDDSLAFMIDAEETFAPRECQYWHYDEKALMCEVKDSDVVDAMLRVFGGDKKSGTLDLKKYSWKACFDSIIGLC